MRVMGGAVQPSKLSGLPILGPKQREEEIGGGGGYEERDGTFSGPGTLKL